MSIDPYSVLGVARTASEDEIKSAYRAKVKALHPDLHPGDELKAEQFKQVSAAFEVIGDPVKRSKYDRGEIDADGHETGRYTYAGGGGAGGQGGMQGDPFEDILSGLFGGRGRRMRTGPVRGRDVRYAARVSFNDAVNGARRRMTMSDGRTLEVEIPAGIETGQTLRLRSQGMASPNDGPPGDALLEMTVEESRTFERDGDDLRMRLPVPLATAVLGGSVEVATPGGPVTLKVPAGSNSGTTLRLRGKGVQRPARPGHLFVRVEIVLDDPADPDLTAFLRQKSVQ